MHFLENLFNLHGQVAVIIGGTGELCGHMALGLAQAGANVVLVGRSEAKAKDRIQQIEAAGGSAYFVAADVADKASIQQVLDSVLERSGRVDILINGAGINSPTPVLEITTEEFNNILKTQKPAEEDKLTAAALLFDETHDRGFKSTVQRLKHKSPEHAH